LPPPSLASISVTVTHAVAVSAGVRRHNGFLPDRPKTVEYFRGTGATTDAVERFAEYYKAQGLLGMPQKGDIDYSQDLELDLSSIKPSVAGPKRPQDRIDLDKVSARSRGFSARR